VTPTTPLKCSRWGAVTAPAVNSDLDRRRMSHLSVRVLYGCVDEQRGTSSNSTDSTHQIAAAPDTGVDRVEVLTARHRRLRLALLDALGGAAPKHWTTIHDDGTVTFHSLDPRAVEALIRALEGLGRGRPMPIQRSTLLGQLALALDLAPAPTGHITTGAAK
jgi:hypothetical protein